MHLNPWLLPPPSSVCFLGGSTSTLLAPLVVGPQWAALQHGTGFPSLQPAQCQGASEGSWVPKHKPPFMSQPPTRPKTWHYDLGGGCSDTSFLPKRALHPLPWVRRLPGAGQLLRGMCQTPPRCGTKRCPKGVLPQQPTHPGPPNPSQAMGKPGRPFRARVRRRKKVYMPSRHMDESK